MFQQVHPAVPAAAAPIVRRYHRMERLVNWLLAALIGLGVAGFILLTSQLLIGLFVALLAVIILRAPVFRKAGTTRLRSTAGPESVLADFRGDTPPILLFQWGIAQTIDRRDDTTVYEFAYLFGRRSTTMAVEREPDPTAASESGESVTITVTANDVPWGEYSVTVRPDDAGTTVAIDLASTRRFDLVSVVQGMVANRYYSTALEAMGYTLEHRDTSISV